MSETVTESSPALTVTQILTDYEIHHSTLRPEPSDRNRAHDTSSPAPNNWPSEHRRIPPHRPINTNLDYSERGARNTAEAVFAFMMLNGCHINASVAHIWRNTGGRLNNGWFRYGVGGEL